MIRPPFSLCDRVSAGVRNTAADFGANPFDIRSEFCEFFNDIFVASVHILYFSTTVSPEAISPAITIAAPARRSVALTVTPVK